MNKYKELHFFVSSQVQYYYKHTELLEQPYHLGKFDAFKSVLEYINDYKEVPYKRKELLQIKGVRK